MKDFAQLLLLVAIAGAVVTLAGSVAIWLLDEPRRIRRALARVLGANPDVLLVARGRGAGAALVLPKGLCGVAWDSGDWCLVYKFDELMGAELSVDGQVVGRAFRGEPRRPVEQRITEAGQVNLRLIFDDPHHPDFDLELWREGDETRIKGATAAAAAKEANRWLARVESIVRRPLAPKGEPDVATPAPPPAVAAPPSPPPSEPPWDEDPDDEDDDETDIIT